MNLIRLFLHTKWLMAGAAVLLWTGFYCWVLHTWFMLDIQMAVWDGVVSNILLLTGSLLLSEILRHYVPAMGRFWYALGLSFLLAFLCLWVTQQALEPLGQGDSAYLAFSQQARPVRWGFYFLVITGVSVSSMLYSQLHEQKEMLRREAATAAMAREAELQKLQLQLQPHFLFNCLNSVNALIQVRPAEARNMVQHLSDFLRITLKRADEHWISLAEEWRYLQLYLEIEKVRFGHRLAVETSFQEGSFDWKLPTLLLQPLVENAIKFGLYGTTGQVTIQITAAIAGQLLHIRVTNPLDEDTQPPKGSGFGLTGLKRRLYLLFARNDLLETNPADGFFTVTLKIPRSNE